VSDFVGFKINGGKELDALLTQLPQEVETKIMRNALAAGANIIRDEARALIRVKTGLTRDSIKSSRGKTEDGFVMAKVSLSRKRAFIGYFLEYGVAAHQIWAKSKQSLVVNGVPIGKQVWHPGFAPKPFFRPAIDAKAGAAVQEVGNYLTRHLQWGTITAPTVAVDREAA
jgi:HK97 gp10 family phage protein